MAKEEAPAYQWYVKDWRSSRKVHLMSFKERGMYREMLDEQWEAGPLPNDPDLLAKRLGGTIGEWRRSLPILLECFVVLPDGRLQNVRLEKERQKQQKRRDKGAAGGQAKATNALLGEVPSSPKPLLGSVPSSPNKLLGEAPSSTTGKVRLWHAGARLHLPLHLPLHLQVAFAKDDAPAPAPAEVLEAFAAEWQHAYGYAFSLIQTALQQMQLEQQVAGLDAWQVLAAVRAYFESADPFVHRAKHPLPLFLKDPLKYLAVTKPGNAADSDDAAWAAIAKAGPSVRPTLGRKS